MGEHIRLEGTDFADEFQFATRDSYTIRALGGNDTIKLTGALWGDLQGGSGDDLLWFSGDGVCYLDGGIGADTLRGGIGENCYHADADDTLVESGGLDIVLASFNLTLQAGFERGGISGSARSLTGSSDNNALSAFEVDHRLGVTIAGMDGDDDIFGSLGSDIIFGGTGNDIITGYGGTDTMHGGWGFDVADYFSESIAAGISANLATGLVRFIGKGWKNEQLIDFEGIATGGKDDILFGSAGSDLLAAGGGDNHIYGGLGADRLVSDWGSTIYHYRSTTESKFGARDVVDFMGAGSAWGHRIDLRQIDANKLIAGDQNFRFDFTGTGGVWTEDAWAGRTWLFANTDADAGAELAIMLIDDENWWLYGDDVLASDYAARDFIL